MESGGTRGDVGVVWYRDVKHEHSVDVEGTLVVSFGRRNSRCCGKTFHHIGFFVDGDRLSLHPFN